jgi:hypothetical protein
LAFGFRLSWNVDSEEVNPSMIRLMLRTIVFSCLITSAFATETLDTLVNASAGFSTAILQQLAVCQARQGHPTPTTLAEKIAKGQEARSREVDMFAQTFSVAGEKQEKAADEATEVLLKRFSRNPDIQKAKTEFERAQKVEERFHKDFDGVDFT